MKERLIAKVYVDKAVFHFDRAFDYLVPETFAETLKRGCRVLVPFGNGNRKRQGIVKEICPLETGLTEAQTLKIKSISSQLDQEPVFQDEMFEMAEFLCNHTFCTFYDAVKTILPNAFGVHFTEYYRLTRVFSEDELQDFSYEERNLIGFLQSSRTEKELNSFLQEDGNLQKKRIVSQLLEKGVIERSDLFRRKVSEKTVKLYRLSDQFEQNISGRLTAKQQEVVDFLSGVGTAEKKELLYFCAVGESVVKRLHEKGILTVFEREVLRTPQDTAILQESLEQLVLSPAQQNIFDGIVALIHQQKAQAALLHGITGSGKTAVFVKLIEQVVAFGKQALMLVPEISLTPQISAKFKALFGEKVAVMHSSLSLGERMDEYKRIRQGIAQIAIGTRSAVFAPFSDLGIIIMDEEGEPSYKSEASPRYHAREVAKLRCIRHNALLLLASATPSIESYYRAKTGVYRLFELKERYAGAVLPEVYLVDMQSERKQANTTSISRMLQSEIEKNIRSGEQSILFINRRGYHTAACCLDCGEVVKCPHCDVPLTYHRDNGYMMCHYCGHAHHFERRCTVCGGDHVKLSGLGTQKVQDELSLLFPDASVLRMDADSTYSRYAYSEKFEAFRQGKYDILVGTQMIAKGLDFPNVTLVGVLNGDSGLYSNDYRGVERVFSLITQVVGRSGRAQKTGRAYIQTDIPDNPVINYAACQDYKSFYEEEIACRKALLYPPFCDICTVGFSGVREQPTRYAAETFLKLLRSQAEQFQNQLALRVLGPVQPAIYRMSGKYRWKVIIKCHCNAVFRNYLRSCLYQTNSAEFRQISMSVDMNGDINI